MLPLSLPQENAEKIKVFKVLPYLVSNVVEVNASATYAVEARALLVISLYRVNGWLHARTLMSSLHPPSPS